MIQAPNAYCQTPPYHSYSVSVNFVVNGVSISLGQFTYKSSNGLPTSTSALSGLVWTVGKARSLSYFATAPKVANSGVSTVVVELYSWSWNPYDYQSTFSSLNYLGVITPPSTPNTGTVSLTLNVTSRFDWTQALYIISLTSGFNTYREYAVIEESTFSAHTQCQYWQNNALPNQSPFQSCPLSNSLFAYTPCTGAQQYPNFIPNDYCYQGNNVPQACYYSRYNQNPLQLDLWLPYLPTPSLGPVVQYFVSTQFPQILCCSSGSTSPDCTAYKKQVAISPSPNKRSSSSSSSQLPYSLGLAFGSLHFVSLDGTHFTFSGLG